MRIEAKEQEASVTELELFFDLVFVFALTQVTALMAEDLSLRGVVRGLLIIGLLWWSWVCYSWLGNVVRADEGAPRAAMLVAMTSMFLLALTIPESFDDLPGGLPGPVVIAVCYFLFRAVHLLLFWIISREDRGLRKQVLRFVPSMVSATVLLLIASQTEGVTQTLLWAAALVADYGGNFLGGASGWRIRSPRHFAERHGLILIVALGESIVAIGVGIAALPISWPIVVASVLGLTLSAALWWTYFDVTALMAERAFSAAGRDEQPRLARDAYSYLHAPMAAGIVLIALGLKKVLEYVGDPQEHDLVDPLKGVGLYALYGGVVVYLLANVVFKLRIMRRLNWPRLVLAAVLVAVIWPVEHLPALAALAVLVGLLVALEVGETIYFGRERYRLRHGNEPHD